MLFVNYPIAGEYTVYIDCAISLLILIGIIVFCVRFKLSIPVVLFLSLFTALFTISSLFDLQLVKGLTFVCIAVFCVIVTLLMTNREKAQKLKYHKKVNKKDVLLTADETQHLIDVLYNAVKSLSDKSTGALITIERSDDILEVIEEDKEKADKDKEGTLVDAPVSVELLETIFYKGTPLHDGATIIRGKNILKSAVFYTPTKNPLNGTYGSRHRAAIGISEVCDAITIIVSEETGKVSFAFKGELLSVAMPDFKTKFNELYIVENK